MEEVRITVANLNRLFISRESGLLVRNAVDQSVAKGGGQVFVFGGSELLSVGMRSSNLAQLDCKVSL